MSRYAHIRHAELVSASIALPGSAEHEEKWTLTRKGGAANQVQGDEWRAQ